MNLQVENFLKSNIYCVSTIQDINASQVWCNIFKKQHLFAVNHKFGSKRFSYNACITNFMGSFQSKIPKVVFRLLIILPLQRTRAWWRKARSRSRRPSWPRRRPPTLGCLRLTPGCPRQPDRRPPPQTTAWLKQNRVSGPFVYNNITSETEFLGYFLNPVVSTSFIFVKKCFLICNDELNTIKI